MPTRKISDLPGQKRCDSPEHNPPTMILLEPGIYEHECPRCGNVNRFIVPERGRLGRWRSKSAGKSWFSELQ